MNKCDAVLTIDQGNTKTKLSVVADGKILRTLTSAAPSLEAAVVLLADFEICGAIYCSVAGLDARFIESLRHLIHAPVEVLTHSTPLPIRICYDTPGTLGLDRVAASVAAAGLCRGEAVMVVDAGTAMTIDIVDRDGRFRGGNIAPGLSLRFQSLHDFTGQLPLVASDGPVPEFGSDTHTAIRAGVVRGAACEITGAFRNAAGLFDVARLVISGGDAPILLPLLENDIKNIIVVHDIVSLGLDLIFRYNDSIISNENL